MQLSKLVNFYKVLGDPTRIRMIVLLSKDSLNGQELAERLSISTPTVTHHVNKLRDAGLLEQRREKNTIYFSLDERMFERNSGAIFNLLKQAKREDEEVLQTEHAKVRISILSNFYTKEGKLKHIPSQLKKKLIVLEAMVDKLEPGRKYQEKEINDFIKQFHEDFATIRREFIMHQFMYREDSVYELNPRELWTKWENLS